MSSLPLVLHFNVLPFEQQNFFDRMVNRGLRGSGWCAKDWWHVVCWLWLMNVGDGSSAAESTIQCEKTHVGNCLLVIQ